MPSKMGGTKTATGGNPGPESPLGDLEAYDVGEQQRGGTLGNILGQGGGPFPQGKGGPSNMMLMSMLSDVPAANSPSPASSFPFLGQAKPRKQRKRKGTTDGRSPKRKASEDDGLSLTPSDLDDAGGLSLQFEGTPSPFSKTDNALPGEPFLESDAGQGKMPSSLLNPADSSSTDGFQGPRASDSFRMSQGDGFLPTGEGPSAARGEGDPSDGGDPAMSRLQSRKLKRLKSDDGTRLDAREELKLEREGSRSLDSGPKNLHSGGDPERPSAEGGKPRVGSPPVTSFKIEKLGDGLKISKAEGRMSKGKDSESKKKADARRERKRKKIEEAELTPEGKVAVLHGLPPEAVRAALDLDAKSAFSFAAIPLSSTGRVTPSGKKPSSGSSSPSLSGAQKLEKLAKPSPPQTHAGSASQRVSPVDLEGRSSSGKTQKHKTGVPPPKSNAGGAGSVGTLAYISPVHTSPSMGPSPTKLSVGKSSSTSSSAALKLKHLNLPSSTTITPIAPKSAPTTPSPTSSAPPSISIIPAASVTSSNNVNRPPKSRKGSLSAVIAKLTNTASSPVALEVLPKVDAAFRATEKKESTITVPKDPKEKEAALKNSEGKMKYSSSDQFTVKQGSGIKLTVTKTSGIYKSSSKSKMQSSPGRAGLSSSPKTKGSNNPTAKASGTSGAASTKRSPPLQLPSAVPPTNRPPVQARSSVSPQRTYSPVQQPPSSSPLLLSPRVTSSSGGNCLSGAPPLPSKVPTSTAKPNSSSGTTKTVSSVRGAEKKSESRASTPSGEKVSSTLEASLMPPPSLVCGTSREELEECFRASPLSKSDTLPLEQWPATKPSDIHLASDRVDHEEKVPRVSSSTDARPNSTTKNGPDTAASSDLARFDPISTTLEESVNAFKAQRPLKPRDNEESSPEDGLVIDFPDVVDRKGVSSRGQSPKVEGGGQELLLQGKAVVSPGALLGAKSPYFAQASPLKSPQVGSPPSSHSVSSSISRPSPCIIDDELMDEAIVGIGK